MEDGEIQAGQLVEVPLYLSNCENILSFEGLLTFYTEHLTLDTLIWSELVDGFTIETNIKNGEIKIAGAGTLPDGQEGILATLNFAVADNFIDDSTVVTWQRLRLNEGEIMENVAHSTLSRLTSVGEMENNLPKEFQLQQNYPNPFNPTTIIRYGIPRNTQLKLTIFNIVGKKVVTLVDKSQQAGWHNVIWNGFDEKGRLVSSGIYLMRLEAADFVDMKKIVFIKLKKHF